MLRPAFGLGFSKTAGGLPHLRAPTPATLVRKWNSVTEEIPPPFTSVPQRNIVYRAGDPVPGTIVTGELPEEGWVWVSHMSPEQVQKW